MATNTTAVAKQVRLQQWTQQITDCQNRPVGMKVIDWCDANGIILPKLTTITGLSRFGHSFWNLWNKRKLSLVIEITGFFLYRCMLQKIITDNYRRDCRR